MVKSSTKLFLALILYRLANVLFVNNYMHPDETWQSLEVAHRLVFGYGYLTWEWTNQLRGFAFPYIFAALYRILLFFRLDKTLLLIAPYTLMAIMSAITDYNTFVFTRKFAGIRAAKWALFCTFISWVTFSGLPRPLANSIETTFASVAYAYWPWAQVYTNKPIKSFKRDLVISLAFASIACILRPTNAITWVIAGLILFANSNYKEFVFRVTSLIGVFALAVMAIIDRLGYGEWCNPGYNFYKFNVKEDLAVWFGKSSVFYHFVVTIPVLFTTLLPFLLYGIYTQLKPSASTPITSYLRNAYKNPGIEPAIVVAGSLIVYSFAGHKEYRFLYSILPIGFMYIGIAMDSIYGSAPGIYHPLYRKINRLLFGPSDSPNRANSSQGSNKSRQKLNSSSGVNNPERNERIFLENGFFFRYKNYILLFLALSNLPLAIFVNTAHGVGVVRVMKHLRNEAALGKVTDIVFLMPCHSTPFYSHLHYPIPMTFLTCEPPMKHSELDSHYWEAKDFDLNPIQFLQINFIEKGSELVKPARIVDRESNVPHQKPILVSEIDTSRLSARDRIKFMLIKESNNLRFLPSHLVLYRTMEPKIQKYLASQGYRLCAEFFNTFWEPDIRRRGDVLVYCT